jgi:tetratricopeptide (TPR) repeat protein
MSGAADPAPGAPATDLQALLRAGEALTRRGQQAEALRHYRDLRAAWPGNGQVAARLVLALAATGEGQAALALYRAEVAQAAIPEDERSLVLRRLATANRRDPALARLLEERLATRPADAALLREAAAAAAAAGRDEAAMAYFARAAALAPLPYWALAQWLQSAVRRRRAGGALPVMDTPLIALLEEALRRFPAQALFLRDFNSLPLPAAAWQRLYRLIRDNLPARPEGFLGFEAAKSLLQAGEIAEGRRLLGSLDPASVWAARAAPLLAALAAEPEGGWAGRLADDKSAEIQVQRVPGARMTVIVFATIAGDFMMMPLACLDALLATLPANIVYLRDTVWASGLAGLRSLGPSIEATTRHLAGLVASLGAKEVVTVGGSVSSLSAIRYGARIGAARVVTFGAMTTVDPDFAGTPARLQRSTRRAQAAAPASAERFGDIAAELAAAPGLRVAMHLGADCALDQAQAAHVAGIPAIALHAEAGVAHHYVALSIIAQRRFASIVGGAGSAPA